METSWPLTSSGSCRDLQPIVIPLMSQTKYFRKLCSLHARQMISHCTISTPVLCWYCSGCVLHRGPFILWGGARNHFLSSTCQSTGGQIATQALVMLLPTLAARFHTSACHKQWGVSQPYLQPPGQRFKSDSRA